MKSKLKNFPENRQVAKEGGSIAGRARKDIEKRTGKKVIFKKNFLSLKDNKKLKK